MGAVHRRGCLTLQAADEPLRWASGRPRGEGRGPVAPPVFKTGLSPLVGDGRFDSFPSPPTQHFSLRDGGPKYLKIRIAQYRDSVYGRERCSEDVPTNSAENALRPSSSVHAVPVYASGARWSATDDDERDRAVVLETAKGSPRSTRTAPSRTS